MLHVTRLIVMRIKALKSICVEYIKSLKFKIVLQLYNRNQYCEYMVNDSNKKNVIMNYYFNNVIELFVLLSKKKKKPISVLSKQLSFYCRRSSGKFSSKKTRRLNTNVSIKKMHCAAAAVFFLLPLVMPQLCSSITGSKDSEF